MIGAIFCIRKGPQALAVIAVPWVGGIRFSPNPVGHFDGPVICFAASNDLFARMLIAFLRARSLKCQKRREGLSGRLKRVVKKRVRARSSAACGFRGRDLPRAWIRR